jgi:O-antigen ligase
MLALGLLILLGLPRAPHRIFVRLRALVWPLILIVGLAIAATGSRGGLLALGAGLFTLMWGRGSFTDKVRNTLLVSLLIAFLAGVALRSDTVTARFEKAVQGGDLCHREAIYPCAWQLFLEKPLLGWGPVANTYELGGRLRLPNYVDASGAPRIDTHNLVLYVLTATGMLGALPFLAGTWLCILGAWRARSGVHGILPLAMVVSVLVVDMSVSGLHWKHHWLVMAYGLASAGPAMRSSTGKGSKATLHGRGGADHRFHRK